MDKSRIEKIRILAALHDGLVTRDDLRQNKRYRFQEIKPGVFEFEGKTYSQEEMDLVFEQAKAGYEKSMMLLGKPIEEPVLGFVFLLPDIPEPVKPVIVEEAALPPSSTVQPQSTTKGYLDQLYDEAEITNQEEPGESIKPEVIVDQQENDKEPEKPILLRNITNQFLY